MRSKLTIALCAALAALYLVGPLAAQLPRQRRLDTFSQIRSHLRTGGFARTVTVSPVGGDYAEPDLACSYVATQTRSATATWLVLVYPGNYTTDCAGTPVATPTFTSVFRYSLGGLPGSPFNRVVVVDPSGAGDFLTIKEACDYVMTQARTDAIRWIIDVYPGPAYTEAAFTIPSYTSVRGQIPHTIIGLHGQIRILQSGVTSGTFIALQAGSALANVNIQFTSTLTGPTKIVEMTGANSSGAGSGAALLNVGFDNFASSVTHALSYVETTSSLSTGLSLYYVSMTAIANSTNTTFVKHQNTGVVYIIDSLFSPQSNAVLNGIHNVSTGTVSITRSSIGRYYSTNSEAMVTALRNDTTGRIEPVDSVWWGPTVGTIDDWHSPTRMRTFIDTPPAACSPIPSEIMLDIGATKRICVCVAANDWDCATLTP